LVIVRKWRITDGRSGYEEGGVNFVSWGKVFRGARGRTKFAGGNLEGSRRGRGFVKKKPERGKDGQKN